MRKKCWLRNKGKFWHEIKDNQTTPNYFHFFSLFHIILHLSQILVHVYKLQAVIIWLFCEGKVGRTLDPSFQNYDYVQIIL